MNIPSRYREIRETLPDEVSFGCGGIKLFAMVDMEEGQLGYSVHPNGTSLCSGEDGAWRSRWVVIGYETAWGAPIFYRHRQRGNPVFAAMHGEGAWNPNPWPLLPRPLQCA